MAATIRFVGVVTVDGIRCKVCEQAGRDFGLYGEDGGVLHPAYMTREQLVATIPQLSVGSAMRKSLEANLVANHSLKASIESQQVVVEEPDYW